MSGATALHARLVFTIELWLGLLALWGLFGGLLRRPVSRFFQAALAIGQLLFMSEAALGVWLWLGGGRAAQFGLHVIYAVVACATIPATHQYLRDNGARRYHIGMALGCLFLLGIVVRSVATGRGG